MLVLSRKIKETILIGDEIEISILSIQGDQVKLGINAPKHIDIHRKEVYLSIQESNSEAASISTSILDQIKNQNFNFK